jgi:hypothetical protein
MSEPLNPIAMILAINKVAEFPPSPGYEPLLIRYGLNPIFARTMAIIAIRHGKRRAMESGWHRRIYEAVRFLAEPDRQRRAILARAQLLLEAWDKTSIIETVFDEIGLIESEFIGLLKALSRDESSIAGASRKLRPVWPLICHLGAVPRLVREARCSQRGAGSALAAPAASQLVQLAGMSERLPSGSTTSNSKMPRRFIAPITCNERPSNGCRSRRIVTKLDMSRRWVVCDGFLR